MRRLIKEKPPIVLTRFRENYHQGLCISSVTLAELAHGVEKSEHREKNAVMLERLLKYLPVVPFDDAASYEYGKICAYLQRQGTPIGQMDMLIAAHAKVNCLTLVTNNIREFLRVPRLDVENWYEQNET
mgnify:CR=1 FL=1